MKFIRKHYRWLLALGVVLASVIGFYSFVGFIWLPTLLKSQIAATVHEQFGVEAECESIKFNPFSFALQVNKLLIRDKSNQPLLDIGMLYINLDAGATLHYRQLRIGEIDITDPQVTLRRLHDGQFNFALPQTTGASATPPFLINKFSVENAVFSFEDASIQPTFNAGWHVQQAEINNLSSQTDSRAEFSLSATKKDKNDHVAIKGQLALAPLFIDAELDLQNLDITEAGRYLLAEQEYKIKSALLSARVHYILEHNNPSVTVVEAALRDLFIEQPQAAAYLKSKEITLNDLLLNLNDASLELRRVLQVHNLVIGVQNTQANTPPAELVFPLTEIDGVTLNTQTASLKIERLFSSGIQLSVLRSPNGQITIPGAIWPMQKTTPSTEAAQVNKEWKLNIATVQIEQCQTSLSDLSVTPSANFVMPPFNLRLDSFSTQAGQPMQVSFSSSGANTGKAGIEGKISINPLLVADFHISAQDIPLPPLQPYLEKYAQINLISGLFAIEGDIDVYQGSPDNSLRFAGEIDFKQLLSRDKRFGKDLLGWKSLSLKKCVFETLPNKRLSIGDVDVVEPYARIVIRRDGKINLKTILTPPAPLKQAGLGNEAAALEKPMPVTIGEFRIHDGQADFSDFSLLPASFSTNIQNINGNIRSLSSEENSQSDVLLEGRLNSDEPVKIFGQINPLGLQVYSDLQLQFSDINMPPFSPYSAKFAGYRIEEGKLTLNLKYLLKDNQLEANNLFQIDRLTLGERVESPDATALPIKLAIALLKDVNGRIEFELPVSGDLSKPETDLGGIVADAALKLFNKLVTAPFSALGGLFSSIGENENQSACIPFPSGQSNLNKAQTEQLASVVKMMEDHPALHLDIRGSANSDYDRKGLVENALVNQLKNFRSMEQRVGGQQEAGGGVGDLSPEDFKRLFIQFYQAKYPDDPLTVLLGDSVNHPDSLDMARKKVLKEFPVRETELRRLAESRAQRLRNALLSQGGIRGDRIYLQDISLSQSNDTPPGACLSLNGN